MMPYGSRINTILMWFCDFIDGIELSISQTSAIF